MTVGIAAICRLGTEQRIILCADTKFSAGEWGSNDFTFKVRWLGKGWSALMAGRLDSCTELAERIKERFDSEKMENVAMVLSAIQRAIDTFSKSPLCTADCCHLLVCGFISEQEPVICAVNSDNTGRVFLTGLASHHAAIGTGGNIATVLLNCRDYYKQLPVEKAIYLVYEAKRLSERADGVGAGTTLITMAPGAMCGFVGDEGQAYLKDIFQTYGFGAGVAVPSELPENFYKV